MQNTRNGTKRQAVVSHLSSGDREVKVQQDRKYKIYKRKFFGFIVNVYWSQELWKIQKGLEIYMEDKNIHSYFRLKAPGI